MIPVVIGAHPSDYLQQAPPNSYILAESFPTVKSLAEYLLKVDGDIELYKSYFKWRTEGCIINSGFEGTACRTCAMLYYADLVVRKPSKWPSRGTNWGDINQCLPANGTWRWNNIY
jgi:glycosyl transferase family 10 (putative fucosyltransferase)